MNLKVQSLKLYPSLSILIGLIGGILVNDYPWLLLGITSIIFVLRKEKIDLIKIFIFFIIGYFLMLNQNNLSENHYENIIPKNKNCGAEIECVIKETKCSSVKFISMPYYVTSQVNKMRFSQNDIWKDVTGEIDLKNLSYLDSNIKYGDKLLLQGAFLLDKEKRIFTVHSIINKGKYDNILTATYAKALDFRDYLIIQATKNFKNKRTKALFAAMIFGCKEGLEDTDKESFMFSGTLHLFAVSGLHIGMVALLFLLITRFIPFKVRHLLLISVLGFYTMIVGMSPSSMRAFIMVSIWALHKAYLYYTPGLNILFLTACILLCINPAELTSISFQYSFAITLIIILSWDKISAVSAIFYSKIKLIPSKKLTKLNIIFANISAKFASLVLISLIAWFASFAISAYYFGYYNYSAIFANIILNPFVFLIFILSIFLFIPYLSIPISFIIERISDLIFGVTASSANNNLLLSKPTLFFIFLFLFFIILYLKSKSRKIIITILFLLGIIFSFFISSETKNELIIISGGANAEPTVVLLTPKNNIIINLPSKTAIFAIRNYFKENGISQIDKVYIKNPNKTEIYGLKSFKTTKIIQIIMNHRNNSLTELTDKLFKQGVRFSFYDKERDELIFQDTNSETVYNKTLQTFSYKNGDVNITISKNQINYTINNETKIIKLKNCNLQEFLVIKF